jgi:hypothetical protein
MVSSDFGKLEVKRHLISGADCAIAGEATAVAAAPAAETFKKSRRFIQALLRRDVSQILRERFLRRGESTASGALWRGGFNMEVRRRIRDKGMTPRQDCTA